MKCLITKVPFDIATVGQLLLQALDGKLKLQIDEERDDEDDEAELCGFTGGGSCNVASESFEDGIYVVALKAAEQQRTLTGEIFNFCTYAELHGNI